MSSFCVFRSIFCWFGVLVLYSHPHPDSPSFLKFFFWVLTSRSLAEASGPLSAKFLLQFKPLVMPLVCCLHKHLTKLSMCFFFFLVLDPDRLIILLIALIHIVCCLKIDLHKTTQMGFVFFLRMFHEKCNHDCNHDYLQCNRNQLYCGFVYS